MNIHDYLLSHENVDWPSVLEDWAWLLPQSFTVWLVNRFGDLIIALDNGTIQLVDVGSGLLMTIAESRNDFAEKIDQGNYAEEWLLISLVDAAKLSGLSLGQNEIYSYKTPPILGGDYTVENFEVCDLAVHYSILGQICRQSQKLADGTKVNIKIEK